MLISEAFRFYEKDKKLLNYSINTLKAYSLQVKLLIKHLGDIEISEITYVQLKEYLIQQEHLKPASLGHRIRFVRSFFRYLHEEDFIQKNVSSKLKEPKMGARIPKSFSEEELELLRDGCSTIIQRLLIEFFYATGCRISEVNNVNIVDINWQDRSIRVIGKGDKERTVYFTVKCQIYLKKYLETRNDTCEALFVTERKPIRRMSIARIREIIKDIAKNSEVNINVYPHRYRHTHAQMMVDRGASLDIVMNDLGHVRISTTMIYAQVSSERKRQEYNKYMR